jgi:hypothetical protein
MKTYRIYASHEVYYVKEVQAESWEDARLQGWENDTGDDWQEIPEFGNWQLDEIREVEEYTCPKFEPATEE